MTSTDSKRKNETFLLEMFLSVGQFNATVLKREVPDFELSFSGHTIGLDKANVHRQFCVRSSSTT
jgi:hypothetical protein